MQQAFSVRSFQGISGQQGILPIHLPKLPEKASSVSNMISEAIAAALIIIFVITELWNWWDNRL